MDSACGFGIVCVKEGKGVMLCGPRRRGRARVELGQGGRGHLPIKGQKLQPACYEENNQSMGSNPHNIIHFIISSLAFLKTNSIIESRGAPRSHNLSHAGYKNFMSAAGGCL